VIFNGQKLFSGYFCLFYRISPDNFAEIQKMQGTFLLFLPFLYGRLTIVIFM